MVHDGIPVINCEEYSLKHSLLVYLANRTDFYRASLLRSICSPQKLLWHFSLWQIWSSNFVRMREFCTSSNYLCAYTHWDIQRYGLWAYVYTLIHLWQAYFLISSLHSTNQTKSICIFYVRTIHVNIHVNVSIFATFLICISLICLLALVSRQSHRQLADHISEILDYRALTWIRYMLKLPCL